MCKWASGLVIAAALLSIPTTVWSQPSDEGSVPTVSRVRSNNGTLRDLITRAAEQSATFRRLVETINSSDGFVYIEPGACRHGVRACLASVKSTSRQRFLFIKVDMGRAYPELIGVIGHELRHAVEVLSEPAVTDYSSMYFFYKANADRIGTSTGFETKAAVKAGENIIEEIREFERAKAASGRR
jgi:hypothetical protein